MKEIFVSFYLIDPEGVPSHAGSAGLMNKIRSYLDRSLELPDLEHCSILWDMYLYCEVSCNGALVHFSSLVKSILFLKAVFSTLIYNVLKTLKLIFAVV